MPLDEVPISLELDQNVINSHSEAMWRRRILTFPASNLAGTAGGAHPHVSYQGEPCCVLNALHRCFPHVLPYTFDTHCWRPTLCTLCTLVLLKPQSADGEEIIVKDTRLVEVGVVVL